MRTDPPNRSGRLAGLLVLLVDDHADERALYEMLLAESGAAVAFAQTWREAGLVVELRAPDVIVAATPSLRAAPGFTRQLRATLANGRERNPRMRALALTPYARARDRGRVLALGFDEHLPKPCDPGAFLAVVHRLSRRDA